jgi:hypothetical protein
MAGAATGRGPAWVGVGGSPGQGDPGHHGRLRGRRGPRQCGRGRLLGLPLRLRHDGTRRFGRHYVGARRSHPGPVGLRHPAGRVVGRRGRRRERAGRVGVRRGLRRDRGRPAAPAEPATSSRRRCVRTTAGCSHVRLSLCAGDADRQAVAAKEVPWLLERLPSRAQFNAVLDSVALGAGLFYPQCDRDDGSVRAASRQRIDHSGDAGRCENARRGPAIACSKAAP